MEVKVAVGILRGGGQWSIDYYSSNSYDENQPSSWAINHALNYKLGSLIVHACYSDNDNSVNLCSSNGLMCSFDGVTHYSQVNVFSTMWGMEAEEEYQYFTIGGLQKTNKIQNVNISADWYCYIPDAE